MAIFILATLITFGILSTITIILSRRYVKKEFTSIDNVLDRILAKDPNLRHEITSEARLSKLTHKASRIMDMYISETTQTIEEKEIIQGFISDMSHQMKTPLSGISMYTDLLIEGSLNKAQQQEFLSGIKNGTNNLQWMMDSLIKMSRMEVGAIELAPVCQNIKQTISDAIGSVLAAASKNNIEITASDFIDTPLLHDKRWTIEAIANILENAVKYSKSDSKINISIEPLPLYTKIIITDYGIGIDKSDWHLIFKRFYRGKNAKNTDGAGLGLYLAALIMEKQGGYIMVDSVVGKFTSFSLFLQNCKKLCS